MTRADVVGAADGVAAILQAVNSPGYRDCDRLQGAIAPAVWGSVLGC